MKWLIIPTLIVPLGASLVVADSFISEKNDTTKYRSLDSESVLNNPSLMNNNIVQSANRSYGDFEDLYPAYDPIVFPYSKKTYFDVEVEYKLNLYAEFYNRFYYGSRSTHINIGYSSIQLFTNKNRKISLSNVSGNPPNRYITLSPLIRLTFSDSETMIARGSFALSESEIKNIGSGEYLSYLSVDLDYSNAGLLNIGYNYVNIPEYKVRIKKHNESYYHYVGASSSSSQLKFPSQPNNYSSAREKDYFYGAGYNLKDNIDIGYKTVELDTIAMTRENFNSWKNTPSKDIQLVQLKDYLKINGKPFISTILNQLNPEPDYLIEQLSFKDDTISFLICENNDSKAWQKVALKIIII